MGRASDRSRCIVVSAVAIKTSFFWPPRKSGVFALSLDRKLIALIPVRTRRSGFHRLSFLIFLFCVKAAKDGTMIPAVRRRSREKSGKYWFFNLAGQRAYFGGWCMGFGEIIKYRLGRGGRKRSLNPSPRGIHSDILRMLRNRRSKKNLRRAFINETPPKS